jgi:hypothetical protein
MYVCMCDVCVYIHVWSVYKVPVVFKFRLCQWHYVCMYVCMSVCCCMYVCVYKHLWAVEIGTCCAQSVCVASVTMYVCMYVAVCMYVYIYIYGLLRRCPLWFC